MGVFIFVPVLFLLSSCGPDYNLEHISKNNKIPECIGKVSFSPNPESSRWINDPILNVEIRNDFYYSDFTKQFRDDELVRYDWVHAYDAEHLKVTYKNIAYESPTFYDEYHEWDHNNIFVSSDIYILIDYAVFFPIKDNRLILRDGHDFNQWEHARDNSCINSYVEWLNDYK